MRWGQGFFPLHDRSARKIRLFLPGICGAVSVPGQFFVTLSGTRSLQELPQVQLCSERCAELQVLQAKGAVAWLSRFHPIFPGGCTGGVSLTQRRGLLGVGELQGWSDGPEEWSLPAWRVSPSLRLGGSEPTAQGAPRVTPSVKTQG